MRRINLDLNKHSPSPTSFIKTICTRLSKLRCSAYTKAYPINVINPASETSRSPIRGTLAGVRLSKVVAQVEAPRTAFSGGRQI